LLAGWLRQMIGARFHGSTHPSACREHTGLVVAENLSEEVKAAHRDAAGAKLEKVRTNDGQAGQAW